MSLQPSLRSKNNDLDKSHWHKLLIFAEVLSTQFSLESQLTCVSSILSSYFYCTTRIWLDASFSNLVRKEGLQNNTTLVSDLSPIMEQAYRERHIIPNLRTDSKYTDVTLVIAIPLLIQDQVLGIIQLGKSNQVSFTLEEVELINGFAIQFTKMRYKAPWYSNGDIKRRS
jgi:GAF domain-containing protein